MPTNHNDNWTNVQNRLVATRKGYGTNLETTSQWGQYYAQNGAFFELPLTVEVNVLSYSDTPCLRFNNENNVSKPHSLITGHWKIIFKTDTITVLKDNNVREHQLNDLLGSVKLKIYWELSHLTDLVDYRNFIIYSI